MPEVDEKQKADEQYNPYGDARDLYRQEQETGNDASVNAGIDQAEAFANDPKNATSKNIDNVDQQEQSGGNWTTNMASGGKQQVSGKGKFLRRKGPAALLFGGLGVGGFLLTTLLSPALLLMHVKNVFLNDLSDATPAQMMRTDRMMRNWVKGKVGVRAGFCGKTVTVRCKFATMSGRMEKKFIKAGFEFEDGKKILGRRVVGTIVYKTEDGVTHKMSTPKELADFGKTPEGRSALFHAFNPKTAAFLDSRFGKMLTTKFGLTKRSTEEGKTKKEVDASRDRATGADRAPPAEEGGRFKRALDGAKKLTSLTRGGITAANSLGNVCLVYQTAHDISWAIKTAKMAAFAAFAYEFLKETDKIIAGDADPEVVSSLGDQMTSLSTSKLVKDNNSGDNVDNPDYMKSPTDSQGYRLSAYGDTGAPNANTAKFSLGLPTAGVMGVIGAILAFPSKSSFGKAMLFKFCNKFFQLGAGAAAIATICLGGGPVSVALCFGANVAIAAAISLALGYGIGKLVNYLAEAYGPMTLGAATKGVDVGNAMAVGSGLVLGGMALSNGMMPSKKGDLKTYFAYTDNIRKEAIAANVYDAKKTPFDIYNQYSFAGSIIQPLNATLMSQSTIGGKFASLLGTVTSAFGNFGKASAAYNMPAQKFDPKRYSICDDQEMKDANIDPDMLCTPRFSMSPEELDMDVDANAKYMVDNGHVDEETGEPKSEDYKKFIRYCGIDRTEPFGSTKDAFDGDSWHSGKECTKKSEKMSNFRVYTMDNGIDSSFENEPGSTEGSETGSAATPGSDVAGDDYTKECSKYVHDGASCPGQQYDGECVSFVKFRLVKHGVLKDPPPALGNGKDVTSKLNALGFDVNGTPAVHSVFSTSHTSHSAFGHTGIVSEVKSNGDIVVEEYNYLNDHAYDTRTITKDEYQSKEYSFAHTETKYK